MSRVFATQLTHGLNRDSGQIEPKVKLGPEDPLGRLVRERYGDLVWVCQPNDSPWKPGVIDRMRQTMDDYEEGDWLLLLGNPVLMAMMVLYAGDHVTHLQFLQWSNGEYKEVVIEIDPEFTKEQNGILQAMGIGEFDVN